MARTRSCYTFTPDYDELREMFNSGLPTADIAKHYGVAVSTINRHRKLCGADSFTAGNYKSESGNKKQHDEAVNRIKKYLSDSGSSIEYVGGSTKAAVFRCVECCYEFTRKSTLIYKGCTSCPECKRLDAKNRREHTKEKEIVTETCAECGNEFTYERIGRYKKFCCSSCRNRYTHRAHARKRRNAQTNGSYRPTWRNLYKRGESNCYLCGSPVDPNDYTVTDDGFFIAGNNYPSVDHVLALANGGFDSYENARIAHMKCNGIKRDLPLEVFKCSCQKQSKTVTSLTF